MSKIAVFGSMVADMVAKVGRFPAEGETVIGQEFNVYLGGKGINQCVAAKRLGGDVEMIGCICNDDYGKKFLQLMDAESIKHDNVMITDKMPTGVAQIQIDEKGQNKIVVIPAANHVFGLEELSNVIHVLDNSEYALFQLEMRYEVIEQAIKYAHSKGVKIIFNPAPAMRLSRELLSLVDYLTPNEVELGIIADEDTSSIEGIKRAAQIVLDMGVKNVVATLGSNGALIANQDGINIIPAYRVKNPVDMVAAGDSFNGALAVKLYEGATLEEAVRFANAMGALTVQVKGAIPSLHNRKQVDEFIAMQQQM
ncbi:MAG: ribokinase [Clostridia bacterium]|nr:ribokinase [Clostridia bacterium]